MSGEHAISAGLPEQSENTSQQEPLAQLQEVLEELPAEKRQEVTAMFLSVAIRAMPKSADADMASKFTPDHVTKFLEDSRENMIRTHTERRDKQWQTFGFGIAALATVIALAFILKDTPDILKDIFLVVLGFVGGAGKSALSAKKEPEN